MQMIAATPAHEAMRRNSLLLGMSRRKIQHSPVPDRQQEQQRAEPDHDVPRQVDGVDLGVVGRSSAGTVSRPWTTVLGAVARVRQPRRESGDADPAGDLAVGVEPSEQGLGDVARRLGHELDGGELDRLVVVDPAGEGVADAHLDRDGDRRRR